MTRDEWLDAAKQIIALWPHQPPPNESLAAWFADVSDLDREHVVAAIRSFARDGREWPPTGGMLRQRVVALASDAPQWAETLRWLQRYAQTGVTNPAYGHFEAYRVKAAGVKAAMPTAVARFIEAVGDRQVWEALEQEGGGEARLRDKWRAFAERSQRDATYQGLPDAGLPALVRANSQPGALAEVVRETMKEIER